VTESEFIADKFGRAKTCYEQNFLQFRNLNDQMNRIPTIAVTLTGGLWYGAAIAQGVDIFVKFGLLIFAGVSNIALILSAYRIRDVMAAYLEKIEEYNPASYVSGRPARPTLQRFGNYSMISIYSALMGAAAILSFIGAFFFYAPFTGPNRWAGFVLTVWVILMILRGSVTKKERSP
jgi:hypothetical protein